MPKDVASQNIMAICLALAISLVVWSCNRVEPPVLPTSCTQHDFEIVPLPYEKLPHTNVSRAAADDTSYYRDSAGVLLFEWDGAPHYHPVNMAHRCFILLDAYYDSGDEKYVDLLRRYIERFSSMAVSRDSALFYPYSFDYRVHGAEENFMPAPWYSGMAQGEVLLVLTRAYEMTGDSTYLDLARKTCNALLPRQGNEKPWVSRYDSLGCFWIEEYPLDRPGMTLNGYIAAIFGLYDFYRVEPTEAVGSMLKECLSTIKNYADAYRRPGDCSFYCLEHLRLDPNYHHIHVSQFRHLAAMTGDRFFADFADSLAQDLPPGTE